MLEGIKITELDLAIIKNWLKVDFSEDDTILNAIIFASISYVQTMLGYKVTEKWPNRDDIPDELTIAALLIISHWYDNRQIQSQGTLGEEISYAVAALVDAHKDHMKEYVEEII